MSTLVVGMLIGLDCVYWISEIICVHVLIKFLKNFIKFSALEHIFCALLLLALLSTVKIFVAKNLNKSTFFYTVCHVCLKL